MRFSNAVLIQDQIKKIVARYIWAAGQLFKPHKLSDAAAAGAMNTPPQ